MAGKLIIFSAPSGSGKSTIINFLLKQNLNLHFSISATSRAPRGTEKDGVEYYFLTPDEFRARIAAGDFLEYEDSCYSPVTDPAKYLQLHLLSALCLSHCSYLDLQV